MKLKLLLLLLILLQFSCKDKTEKQAETWHNRVQEFKTQTAKNKKFDFDKFKISKGQLGEIKIGMKIAEAEKFLPQLTRSEILAYDYGYDGGGKAYLYSYKNEVILALIPKRDFDEILAIIAINKNLKTENGLNANATVSEIMEKYPDSKVNQDVMMDWEFMQDDKNNLQFIFETTENNQIGKYDELEIPSQPIRTNIKADWITVK